MPTHDSNPRGFTLFELMVTVTIAVILASMALPMLRNDDRIRLIAAASLVTSDIEFAQSLTIAKPAEPLVIMFDEDADSYHIGLVNQEETPITREDTGEPYLVVFGQGRATAAEGVDLSVSDMNKGGLQFDTHGGLFEFNITPVITLQSGDHWLQLTVSATTGSINETSGTGTPP